MSRFERSPIDAASSARHACVNLQQTRVMLRARGGVVLLEVVMAVSLLLMAMAFVGMAFRNGGENVERAERMSRAMLMADRLLGELDIGVLNVPVPQEGQPMQEATGSFGGESMDGLSWRIAGRADPDSPDAVVLEIEVFRGAPDARPEERQTIVTAHTYKVIPRPVNLEKDFGLSEEQTEQIKQVIPGGEQVFDPANFNPRQLAQLDMEMLTQLLPVLVQAFGGEAVMGQLDGLIRAAKSGDTSGIQQLLQGGQVPSPGGAPSQLPPGLLAPGDAQFPPPGQADPRGGPTPRKGRR